MASNQYQYWELAEIGNQYQYQYLPIPLKVLGLNIMHFTLFFVEFSTAVRQTQRHNHHDNTPQEV
jgi:hypothetical protein